MLNEARENMVVEARRRNDTDRFYRIEVENNTQTQGRIDVANRELAAEKQKLASADEQSADLTSEVIFIMFIFFICHKVNSI